MESIEQRLQTLTGMIQKLGNELDSLKRSGYRPSRVRVYVQTDAGIDAHHDNTLPGSDPTALGGLEVDRNIEPCYPDSELVMLSPAPNDEGLFDIASTSKDVKHTAMPLTQREKQILNCVADGNTNKQTAFILRISEQTIKNHISAILRKLNAKDRAHAVSLAMRHDWLSAERELEDMVAVS